MQMKLLKSSQSEVAKMTRLAFNYHTKVFYSRYIKSVSNEIGRLL